MLFFLIVGLLLGALTVVFALQNIMTITVTFFAWELSGSLALILMLAVLSGIIISTLLSIPNVIKSHMRYRTIAKQNKQLQDEIASYKKGMTTTYQPTEATVVTEKTTVSTINETPKSL